MTIEQKKEWLAKATPEELLGQYVSSVSTNRFGINDEDIRLTRAEILRRMGGERHE